MEVKLGYNRAVVTHSASGGEGGQQHTPQVMDKPKSVAHATLG